MAGSERFEEMDATSLAESPHTKGISKGWSHL